jgi:3-methyladenine DNA glycosylase AlkD
MQLLLDSADASAQALIAALDATVPRSTAALRAERKRASRAWKDCNASFVLEAARMVNDRKAYRWIAYELVRHHPSTFARVTDRTMARLGKGIDSWGSVDAFARILAGPAWVRGRVSDALIDRWARSKDKWWRRAALVSTVAWNSSADGGGGDSKRTLALCSQLAGDHDDMVQKALSWALRALVPRDKAAVREFVRLHRTEVSARVTREVSNKLRTNLKNPRKA